MLRYLGPAIYAQAVHLSALVQTGKPKGTYLDFTMMQWQDEDK